MLRHKKVVSALTQGLSADWNDDHHFDPTDEIDFSTTFCEFVLADAWNAAQTTGATAPTVSLVSGHAFLVLDSTADVGDIATVRFMLAGSAGDITNKTDLPVATFALDVATPGAAGTTHEFGFFRNADTPFTANQRGAYFRIAANVLYAVTGDGAAETTTNLGAPNQYDVYRIEFTSTQVRFYVGSLSTIDATHTANITTADLTMKLSTIGVAAGAQIMRSDFAGLTRLRKQ